MRDAAVPLVVDLVGAHLFPQGSSSIRFVLVAISPVQLGSGQVSGDHGSPTQVLPPQVWHISFPSVVS
jgi:uncharacterized protein (DUF111 family)